VDEAGALVVAATMFSLNDEQCKRLANLFVETGMWVKRPIACAGRRKGQNSLLWPGPVAFIRSLVWCLSQL